jgi:hypothetical protein
MGCRMPELEAEYVLPLRRSDRRGERELLRYLNWLSERTDVTVVDGSDAPLFQVLHDRLPRAVRHIPPRRAGLNGKARGALTGLDLARWERVVVADDDVRYDEDTLADVVRRLDRVEFVRPQNVYTSYPWHARWDSARMLVGRALGGDFGGTVAVRRSAVLQAGGYRTDVLFENLELERTIRGAGGRVEIARDLFIPRIPPTVGHFVGQRVRQAYDGFAQPARMLAELAVLPMVASAIARRAWKTLLALGILAIGLAEIGRRVSGGARAIPPGVPLWTPLWMLERGVAAWIAVLHRLRGGIAYADSRIVSAGTPQRALRRRSAPTSEAAGT